MCVMSFLSDFTRYTTKVITLWYRPPELLLKTALVSHRYGQVDLSVYGSIKLAARYHVSLEILQTLRVSMSLEHPRGKGNNVIAT